MANQQSKTDTQSSSMNKQQPINETAQKGTADNMKRDSSFNQNSNQSSNTSGRQQTTR